VGSEADKGRVRMREGVRETQKAEMEKGRM
jgi:hypothetical protein